MKKSDFSLTGNFPGKRFAFVKNILSGSDGDETYSLLIDSSHMQKNPQRNKWHFLFAQLFALSIATALWQHGSPTFTLGTLALVVPAAFFVYIPSRIMNGLLQQMFACLIFFGSCLWMVYRIQKQIALDMVFIEGLVLCTFSFFVNCTRKGYAYILLISLLLVIYGGLITRSLLLYFIPCAMICLLLAFAYERISSFTGARKLLYPGPHLRLQALWRTCHFYLLQLLLFIPLFIFIFSLIPLKENGDEGLFEVSFNTTRTSVMPPDLKKWLLQDRKIIKGKNAQYQSIGDDPDTPGDKGKVIIPSDQSGKEEGQGKSAAPPGKDLLFTVSMPVKLYHLATLYDVYDGKKWITSPEFKRSKILSGRGNGTNRPFFIESKYTMRKWISPNLYAPYLPLDFTNPIDITLPLTKKWISIKFNIQQSSFNAVLKKAPGEYPPLPYVYTVRSRLLVPVKPRPPVDKSKPVSPVITAPELYSSAEEYFARITEKENIRREKARIAAEKRAAARKAAEAKRAAARKAAEAKRAAARKAAEAKRAAARKAAAKRNKNVAHSHKKPVKKVIVKKPVKKPVVKKAVVKKPVIRKRPKPVRIVTDPVWKLSLPASHFLRLPKDLSPRIAELAKDITKNVHTPYEKAAALRDFLRKNYKYKLYASPVPDGKESVEYFLFELKEGHCEYFAAALTVLARSAGLPARVATGFSPGNYNALTRQFEVYEYHAHAWTQIFIANTGWLTFDAVPPGEIISETTPIGIGRFRDPFDDEWRVMPPELTRRTLEYVQKQLQEHAAQREAERLQREAQKLKKESQAKQLETTKKTVQKTVAKTPEKKVRQVKPTGLKERIQNFFKKCKEKIKEKFLKLITVPEARNTAVVLLIAAVIIFFTFRRIVKLLKHIFYCIRSKSLMERAQVLREEDPAQSVLCLYRALRLLLILAGMERKKNMELIAYAAEVSRMYADLLRKKQFADPAPDDEKRRIAKIHKLEQDLRMVFHLFYSLEYGNCSCSAADAAKCAGCVTEIHAALKELLPHSLLP